MRMTNYKRRNRTDEDVVNPGDEITALNESELVLKLKIEELFDPYILLPHAELNKNVYNSVDIFVEKYKCDAMTVQIFTEPLNPLIQDTFREVYASHYKEELLKTDRYLKRHHNRALTMLAVSLTALMLGTLVTHFFPAESIISYILLNISAFCLWEVGYTHFSARSVKDERKRIMRALYAKIDFS